MLAQAPSRLWGGWSPSADVERGCESPPALVSQVPGSVGKELRTVLSEGLSEGAPCWVPLACCRAVRQTVGATQGSSQPHV